MMPEPTSRPSLVELEQLPYLTAVLHEGLRIGDMIAHRLMRSFPDKSLRYGDQVIPPRTKICMTPLLMHRNETMFPDPATFRPERWLGPDGKKLLRYLVPFNRGTRGCLGLNLAWAEMYLTVAAIFRRFDFDIADVVRHRDVDCVRDCLTAASARTSPGVIVRVLPVLDE